jgi:hypothetical protein
MAVLEKWEFGSIEWCRFAAQTGVELLEKAHLDREKLEWGCSEEYTQVPARLLGSRDRAVWHFMIHQGRISGGASLPEQCLALPGFHVVAPWPLIAQASSVTYDLKGSNGASPRKMKCGMSCAPRDAYRMNAPLPGRRCGHAKSRRRSLPMPAVMVDFTISPLSGSSLHQNWKDFRSQIWESLILVVWASSRRNDFIGSPATDSQRQNLTEGRLQPGK